MLRNTLAGSVSCHRRPTGIAGSERRLVDTCKMGVKLVSLHRRRLRSSWRDGKRESVLFVALWEEKGKKESVWAVYYKQIRKSDILRHNTGMLHLPVETAQVEHEPADFPGAPARRAAA